MDWPQPVLHASYTEIELLSAARHPDCTLYRARRAPRHRAVNRCFLKVLARRPSGSSSIHAWTVLQRATAVWLTLTLGNQKKISCRRHFERSQIARPCRHQIISGACYRRSPEYGRAQKLRSCSPPRTPSRVLPNSRPHCRDPRRGDTDKAASCAECQLAIRFDDYLLPRLQVYLAAGFGQLCGAGLNVLTAGDGQVVISLDLGPAVSVGAVVLFGQVLGVTVGLDAFVPFVADADALVVLDVLIPVALGVDENLLLARLVLDAQFVEAVAAGAAQALEQAAGLVCRQLVGNRVGTVVQEAGDQRLVRVAFQKTDQYFHADARDGHAAPVVAGPAAGHPQPAAGVGIGLAFAVPVELDLDPALIVAVDFFVGRAGDHRGLLAQHPGLGMAQGWAVRGVPGGGLEVVAVVLGEGCFPLSPRGRGLGRGGIIGARRFCAGYGLFQNLGLFAFVVNVGDQPEVVPAVSRVALEFEEVAAAQSRLVAVAGGLAVVAAVAF